MFPPLKVVTECHSEVLCTISNLKLVAMKIVVRISSMAWARRDPQNCTLLWVEAHLPLGFPFLKGCEIVLESGSVLIIVNVLVQEGVISKKVGS